MTTGSQEIIPPHSSMTIEAFRFRRNYENRRSTRSRRYVSRRGHRPPLPGQAYRTCRFLLCLVILLSLVLFVPVGTHEPIAIAHGLGLLIGRFNPTRSAVENPSARTIPKERRSTTRHLSRLDMGK